MGHLNIQHQSVGEEKSSFFMFSILYRKLLFENFDSKWIDFFFVFYFSLWLGGMKESGSPLWLLLRLLENKKLLIFFVFAFVFHLAYDMLYGLNEYLLPILIWNSCRSFSFWFQFFSPTKEDRLFLEANWLNGRKSGIFSFQPKQANNQKKTICHPKIYIMANWNRKKVCRKKIELIYLSLLGNVQNQKTTLSFFDLILSVVCCCWMTMKNIFQSMGWRHQETTTTKL